MIKHRRAVSQAERGAYRLLALLCHPDAGGSDAQMAALNAAYVLVTAHLGR